AALFERVFQKSSQLVFVFDQKHNLGADLRRLQIDGGRLFVENHFTDARQKYPKTRALSRLAESPYIAAALLDDSVRGGKAEARSLAGFLCGEERFED